jgi:hypothetical protein
MNMNMNMNMIPIEKAAAILKALKSLDEAMADADTEYAEDQLTSFTISASA